MRRKNLVFGIDPGTRRTGWGAVEIVDGVLRHVDSGVIAPKVKDPLEKRLLYIADELERRLAEIEPSAAAVEDIFFSKFPQGALKLGHARGVALLAVARAGIELSSYPPAQVKRAISGHGRADKAQIGRFITVLLKLQTPPKEDQSDALAVAICHAAASGRLSPGRR
jgi:crossover junction endodeoxyribonuclease RuvC